MILVSTETEMGNENWQVQYKIKWLYFCKNEFGRQREDYSLK